MLINTFKLVQVDQNTEYQTGSYKYCKVHIHDATYRLLWCMGEAAVGFSLHHSHQ